MGGWQKKQRWKTGGRKRDYDVPSNSQMSVAFLQEIIKL